MSEIYGTFSKAYVEDMRLRLSALETEAVRLRLSELELKNKVLDARVAELEARCKQARDDEAWANETTVLVEFQPVTSGWVASTLDGVRGINATAPTIHGALHALREKMESRPAEKATPCHYCHRVECDCSDADVCCDMGDK